MKNIYALFIMILILPLPSFGQDSLAYWASHSNGEYTLMHLSDASKTGISSIGPNFTGGDFGTDNVLYAIRISNQGFYKIDTATGAKTLLGIHPPPSGQIWMGLAYDEDEGIMYGLSAQGTTVGKSSIYTISEVDGSYTLIGSQWVASALTCIAIDGKGKMYGLNVNDDILYEIDKTDGSVTEVGPIGQSSSGFGHSMDFDKESGTMYLSTFSPSTSTNTLRIVNLTDGSTTEVGDVGTETAFLAVKPPSTLSADFSVSDSTPCEGTAVQFTDRSVDAAPWSWVFEGGLPPSSNYQNPTVIYNNPGSYDVELTVTDSSGGITKTELKQDFITVIENPSPRIIGDSLACNYDVVGYSAAGDSASTFLWTVTGGEIITDDSTSHVTVLWGAVGSGTIDVSEITLDSCTNDAETLAINIDNCVSVEENAAEHLNVYPNPVSGILYLTSESVIKSIAVFDYSGKRLTRLSTNSTNCRLNTSGYRPGIYLLLIETGNTIVQKRIVIK